MHDSAAPASILIVEDEPKLAGLLADYLHEANFATRCIDDGREVTAAVRESAPDLILLDLKLPGRDGIAVCRDLRQFTDTPIVIITGRVGEIDRLRGIELGADDYICKPFSPREVVARIKAILRRSRRAEVAAASPRLVFDVHGYEATLDGTPLRLTPAEFRLLHALAERPTWVFSRDQLLDHLYADIGSSAIARSTVTSRTCGASCGRLAATISSGPFTASGTRSTYSQWGPTRGVPGRPLAAQLC
jgi:two-component system response regulator BaeR